MRLKLAATSLSKSKKSITKPLLKGLMGLNSAEAWFSGPDLS
jgi:hypothetical protein